MQKYRSWVEIDTNAARANLAVFRHTVGQKTAILGMVKSNAYGHGLVQYAQLLEREGIDWLGVDDAQEAFTLRDAGITKPILVVGYTLPAHFQRAGELGVTLTISSRASLEAVRNVAVDIHIEVETGLGRQGISWNDRSVLQSCNPDQVRGIFTHLAAAESPEHIAHTQKQLRLLNEQWLPYVTSLGMNPMRHIAASAATLLYTEFHLDLVRAGISLYGLYPSPTVREVLLSKGITLTPVLSWYAVLSEIKTLPAGMRVGYDLTEALTRDSVIGIVPIGYWHGFPRHLSSVGTVLVEKTPCKVLGRVSMDMIVIDLTDVAHPTVGDTVTIIGCDGDACVSATTVAQQAGTINYEIVTRINQDIPRVYR